MEIIMEHEHEEEIYDEPTLEMAKAMCAESGHLWTRVVADNGHTYETVCQRCGHEA